MRLPSLTVIIAVQAILWCIAGVWIHGWMILVYPLAWLAVLSVFLVHNMMSTKHRGADSSDEVGDASWSDPVGADSKQAVA
jgi:hypothetical protein